MAVPADERMKGQGLEQTLWPSTWGIERARPGTRPAEAEARRISEHEQKSQGPMCSVELGKTPQ